MTRLFAVVSLVATSFVGGVSAISPQASSGGCSCGACQCCPDCCDDCQTGCCECCR